jgi:hypothetical protein
LPPYDPGLDFIEQAPGYEAYVIGADLLAGRTGGFDPIWAIGHLDHQNLDSTNLVS